MTPERFADWLQGFAETHDGPPDARQWAIIRDHLALLFDKVTPERSAAEEFLLDEVRKRGLGPRPAGDEITKVSFPDMGIESFPEPRVRRRIGTRPSRFSNAVRLC